jgi:SDR family mycofactocin-dependent oxidoreductase
MGHLDGKIAFITGAARGMGRAHAQRLSADGADIIAIDICAPIDSVIYPLATPDDLEETAELVRANGRRVVARVADVRDRAALAAAFQAGVDELGGCDIVVANAGIGPFGPRQDDAAAFADVIDVNLTGVYHTLDVAIPTLVDQGRGGSIVLTSSSAGLKGVGNEGTRGVAYTASKHAVVGIMRSFAHSLAPHSIRVNTIHPCGVATPMIMNDATRDWMAQDAVRDAGMWTNLLPVGSIEAHDVAAAVTWLAGDDARYVTGVTLPVDAGFAAK